MEPLTRTPADMRSTTEMLWRITMSAGRHPAAWNALRAFGPIDSRWDPHDPPPRDQPSRAVAYTAVDIPTVVAEVFQDSREVFLRDDAPYLTGYFPTRSLSLLELTGTWAVRNGAAASLTSGDDRAVTQAWARAILDEWPDLDGLWTPSTYTGRPVVVLFPNARDAIPSAPVFSRPLTQPDTHNLVHKAAQEIGYTCPL